MESDARAFINNHDIFICSAWFLFYLIKPRQTRHIVVGGWFILSRVYWTILVCMLSDRSIEGKPQRTFLLNSLDNIIIQDSYILVGVSLYGQQNEAYLNEQNRTEQNFIQTPKGL